MPEIAEAQALLAELAGTDEVKAEAARRERRFKLESSFAQAVGWSKGFAAEEAKVAADRIAHALATGFGDDAERLAAHQPLWATSFMRGEMAAAREAAEDFLRAAESARSLPWEAAARRSMGATLLLQADLAGASKFLEEAMELADRGQDGDRTVGTGPDPGASAATHLSLASWMLGDLDRSHRLIEEAFLRVEGIEHSPTLTVVRYFAALRGMLCGDARATLPLALSLIDFCRDRAVEQFLGAGMAIAAWARARLEDRDVGVPQFRQALAALSEQGNKVYLPLYLERLAEIELAEQGPDAALSRIEQAQALALETGQRIFDTFLERLHGGALLAVDPADTRPAESAFLTSLELSLQQGARAFGLQAALALAKLYQSTGRPADAHAALAPALEGFSPTPEMPKIAEAQALLVALAEIEEVGAVIAQRQRRLDLQTAYGHALMWGRGFAAGETKAAFARVGELAGPTENKAARFAAYDAQCLGSYTRGEYREAQKTAEAYLRDAEEDGRATEAGAARRMLGVVLLFQGDLKAAQSILRRALGDYLPERDGETRNQFGRDTGVSAAAYLAPAEWLLGEIERARQLIAWATRRADELGHAASVASALYWKTVMEALRNDASATRLSADTLLRLTEEHGIKTYADVGRVFANWARGRLDDPEAGASGLRQALTAYIAQGNRVGLPSFHGLLAELEVTTLGSDAALARIDQGLAIAEETGEHFLDPYLYRLRGDILLKRDPINLAPAEDAYRTAIAVAKDRGARSYELLASLALAKRYRWTGRPLEVRAMLAPALEGFSPTPEMPEIAEAQRLLASLDDDGVALQCLSPRSWRGPVP